MTSCFKIFIFLFCISFSGFAQNNGIDSLKRELKLHEERNDKSGIVADLNALGFIYNDLGDIPKALEFYHRGLLISESLNDKTSVSVILNNIGLVYIRQDEIEKALEYYKRSLKISEEINDSEGIGSALLNIGGAYDDLGDIPLALDYYEKSLKAYQNSKDKDGVATALNNIGMIHYQKNDLKGAVNYFQQALEIQLVVSEKSDISYTMGNIANIKFLQGLTNEAFDYAIKSYSIASAIGYPGNIGSAAKILKSIYRKQNKHKEAFEMFQLQIKMRDSINNEETKKASIKKQFQYAYEKQAAQDSVRHAEEQKVKNAQLVAQEAQLNEEKTQRFVLYGGLILMLAGSGLVLNRFRLTQKQNKIIELQKEEVGFAYDQLHSKNKEVMDSINYARRIQNSLMPTEKYISKILEKNRKL